MDKSSLQAKLDDLKQKSEQAINQINQYEEAAKTLRDDALVIKGKYQAIEELIAGIPDPINKKGKK